MDTVNMKKTSTLNKGGFLWLGPRKKVHPNLELW